jgi:hypothetical protein
LVLDTGSAVVEVYVTENTGNTLYVVEGLHDEIKQA